MAKILIGKLQGYLSSAKAFKGKTSLQGWLKNIDIWPYIYFYSTQIFPEYLLCLTQIEIVYLYGSKILAF